MPKRGETGVEVLRVAVGTRNPGKVLAVREGLERAGVEFSLLVTPVASGVSDQPRSAEETLRGARTRAERARRESGAELGVGVEGGLFSVGEEWFECGWVYVSGEVGGRSVEGAAPTAGFAIPPRLLPHLLQGRDLNQAVEAELGIADIGEGEGITGYLSRGVLARKDLYADGVVMALARLGCPELWA